MTVWWIMQYCYSFLIGFNFIFGCMSDSLYYDMDICTKVTLCIGQLPQSQPTGLFLGARWSGAKCHYVFLLLMHLHRVIQS